MTVGARIKEERVRLGCSQTAFAALAGVKKNTQLGWEKDASSPTATALAAWADAGVDVLYVVTGKRTPEPSKMEDQFIAMDLAEIRRGLMDPATLRRPGEPEEQTEKRFLHKAERKLEDILRHEVPAGLSDNLVEEAKALLEAVRKPSSLALLRAAEFVQQRKRREEEEEMLTIFIHDAPYQPDWPVLKLMATMVVEHRVPYDRMVELAQEIYRDIEEQKDAERSLQNWDKNNPT